MPFDLTKQFHVCSGCRLHVRYLEIHVGGKTFEDYHSGLMQWPIRKLIYINIYCLLTFTLHKDNGRSSEIKKNLIFLLCAISFMIFFHKPICQIMLSVRKE